MTETCFKMVAFLFHPYSKRDGFLLQFPLEHSFQFLILTWSWKMLSNIVLKPFEAQVQYRLVLQSFPNVQCFCSSSTSIHIQSQYKQIKRQSCLTNHTIKIPLNDVPKTGRHRVRKMRRGETKNEKQEPPPERPHTHTETLIYRPQYS